MRHITLVSLALVAGTSIAETILPDQLVAKLSYPTISPASYVLIEIWPLVKDITLNAYFLEESPERNRNLCEATRRSLDRGDQVTATEQGKKLTSYRLCLSLVDAVNQGYVERP